MLFRSGKDEAGNFAALENASVQTTWSQLSHRNTPSITVLLALLSISSLSDFLQADGSRTRLNANPPLNWREQSNALIECSLKQCGRD